MINRFMVGALMLGLLANSSAGEYLRIEATEVVTIEPTDTSTSARLLVKWDLSEVLDEKIIDAVVIEMPVALTSGDNVSVDVAPVTTEWRAEQVDWSSVWTKAGGDFDGERSSPSMVMSRNSHTIRADVLLIVREQISGQKDNFGFIVIPTRNTNAKLARVAANDATTLSKAKLVVAYRNRR